MEPVRSKQKLLEIDRAEETTSKWLATHRSKSLPLVGARFRKLWRFEGDRSWTLESICEEHTFPPTTMLPTHVLSDDL